MKALILYIVLVFGWTGLLLWEGIINLGVSLPVGIMFVAGLTMTALVCNRWSNKNG